MSDIYISPTVGLCPIVMPTRIDMEEVQQSGHSISEAIAEEERRLSLAKAEAEKRPFEDQGLVKRAINFRNWGEVAGHTPEENRIYENVPLPACEEVRQWFSTQSNCWIDRDEPKSKEAEDVEYRTVTRFTETNLKDN